MTLLLGTHVHPARGDAARRQDEAIAAMRSLGRVSLVNLQWPDAVIEVAGMRTIPTLTTDSVRMTGCEGIRKPIVRELFDLLAEAAAEAGCSHFCFTNSDIRVSQALVDFVLDSPKDAVAVSRMDVDGETGGELGVMTAGIDTFAVRVEWWRANRWRFRPYVVGEAVWDNVYASILLCHGDAVLLNRGAWTRHERHATAWTASPFAEYTRLLAALDRPYFTRWAVYHDRLLRLRERGAGEDEEAAMRREVFTMTLSPREMLVQVARVIKARLRYSLAKKRSSR